jgi:hypothetical protein
LKKISLNNRNREQFYYSGSDSPKKWVKDTFNGINNGLFPDVAIPERVDISINPQDIPIQLPHFISEVVDTRGFEGNTREDLRQYINSDDTIIVLLDKPTEVPGENQKRKLWV